MKPPLGLVTVVVPHKDTPDWLRLSVEFWLRQNERVFLLIVDTASKSKGSKRVLEELEERPRIEVARLGIGATPHPVDGITAAMDYAFSRCPTRYLLATHTDLFPRHRDLVGHLVALCGEKNPVVGWEMSPRGEGEIGLKEGKVSDGYPGHACTLFHMPTMDRIGAGWSIRRAHHQFGTLRVRDPRIAGWPDTETCIGKILQSAGIRPLFIGRETNNENQWTEHWVHARSRTAMGIQPRHHEVFKWGAETLKQWHRESLKSRPGNSRPSAVKSEPNPPTGN